MELYTFDDEYVRRLREGDRTTEEHFAAYFQKLLLIKLRGKLRSMTEIDDVRQEVIFRAFKAIRGAGGGVRDGRKLGSFVNSICNNVLLETYRSGARHEGIDGSEHDTLPDPDVDIEQAFASGETRERVRRTLDLLPPKDSQILTALFLDEKEKDEICADFGVDRDYLRVLLHRAKEKFRSEYRSGDIPPRSSSPETDGEKSSLRRQSEGNGTRRSN